MVLEFMNFLTQILDPVFLALSVLFGYLVFFLYFYGTNHWNDLEWGDRALLGWIFGTILFVTAVTLTPAILSGWVELMQGSSLSQDSVRLYWFLDWLILVYALYHIRREAGGGIHSQNGKQLFDNFLGQEPISLIYFAVAFSLFSWMFLGYQYPYVLAWYLQIVWGKFLYGSVLLLIFCYASTLSLLYALTDVPRINLLPVLKRIFIPRFKVYKTWSYQKIARYSAVMLMALLLAFSVVSFDSSFGLITPKITLIESRYVIDNSIHLLRSDDMKFVALVSNLKVFCIQRPILENWGIKVFQVRNPANVSSLLGQYQLKVSTTQGLEYKLLAEPNGRISNISFIVKSPSTSMMRTEIEYYDQLESTLSFLMVNETRQLRSQTLPNGSINGTYYLRLTNTGRLPIRIDRVALFPAYFNITYFQSTTETVPQGSAWGRVDISGGWAYLFGDIGPGASIIVSVTLTYRE